MVCEQLPLKVGQLLLQQEHVGFELIPLLKDLLNLLSTEAALPCLGGEPWRQWGIRRVLGGPRGSCARGRPLGLPLSRARR